MSEVIVRLKDRHIKVKGGEYVQDIVRCRECANYQTDKYFCTQFSVGTPEDGYCYMGGRRKGADDE